MRHARFAVLTAAASLIVSIPTFGDESEPKNRFSGTSQVTAVEMVLEVTDDNGRTPLDLAPTDFEVTEDGQPAQVVGVEPFRTGGEAARGQAAAPAPTIGRGEQGAWDWRMVIWIDQELSSSRSIRRAAEAFAKQAGALTALGTVEIVVTGGDRRFALPKTRSAPLVEEKLLALARETPGRDRLRSIRKDYLGRLELFARMEGRNLPGNQRLGDLGFGQPPGGGGDGDDDEIVGAGAADGGAAFSRKSMIRESASAERMVIDRQLDLLTSFLTLNAEPAPKALILVNDGWDIDPREFYLSGMTQGNQDFIHELTALLRTTDGGSAFDGLSKHLSTTGWTTLSVATGAMEAASAMSAEYSGQGRMGEIMAGGDESVTSTPGRLLYRPNEPLYALAEATGGQALTGVNGIPGSLGRLADRVRITYQVERPPDARQRKVEVRALRRGLDVRAPVWAGVPAAEAIASARVRNLLAGDPVQGDLPFEAAVGLAPTDDPEAKRRRGELQARIDLGTLRVALAESPVSDIRVTLAVGSPGAAPFVHQSVVPRQRLAGLQSWTYSLPIDLPREFEKVAVVLEESGTGAWGAGLAAVVEGPLPAARRAVAESADTDEVVRSAASDPDAILELLPARKPLLLSPPESEPALGKVAFEPLVAAENVASVDFLLDGEKVESSDRRPFAVTLDLGELPVPRRLEAVARDAAGAEIGRDSLALNEGVGSFDVRLIEPRDRHRVGPVDVEAELSLPGRGFDELDRVELYWNDRRVATLFAPPFRQRILIPADSPAGFITAVAHRRDGTSVEDVLLMNDAGGAESVEVSLVELAATVLDGAGRPVSGLASTEFRLLEQQAAQTLDAVRDGRELPLTLGLALDSSASMFEEMTAVKSAAIDFLGLTLDPADRAFVVDFDSQPRVAVELTGDLRALGEGIAQLRPGGSTALCDALVYSLARLQRVKGRRALVVLSDGLGRDERVSFAACQRFVARSGVPVYLIMLPESGPADERRSVAAVRRAEELVGPSGGRVVRIESTDRLGQVYLEIQAELRAQYVLSYYPAPAAGSQPGWRSVTVQATRPGLTVRAAGGYYR